MNYTFTYRLIFTLVFTLGVSWNVDAQLLINQQNPTTLVQNVFVNQNSGVTISNITYNGSPQAIGYFDGSATNIGLNSGILMTTGNLGIAVGPNNKPDAGINNNAPGYQPLTALVGGTQTFNASVLQFTFVSKSPDVEFRYVFASEEYPEYVGSQYNDVFAFFISGPGFTGMQNIARIPGTNLPVTINNVNAGSYNQFFVNNGDGVSAGGPTIQFDGFTRPLVAKATVVPCQPYVLTIAIADVSDPIYDSGVFLEANSFTSSSIALSYVVNNSVSNTQLAEGCGNATVTVSRIGNTDSPKAVTLVYTGSATYGVDYTAAPTSLQFAAGQTEISFNIDAFADALNEIQESVTISYIDTGCFGINVVDTTFFIVDRPPPISVSLPNSVVIDCPNQQLTITPIITGGAPPYDILWSNGSTSESIIINSTQTSPISIAVNGVCGVEPSYDTMQVIIKPYDPIVFDGLTDINICIGDVASIGKIATGGSGTIKYSWSDLAINTPVRFVSPITTTTYILTVSDSCGISQTFPITVHVTPVKALYNIEYKSHDLIQFIDMSYADIVAWDWKFGNFTTSTEQNPLIQFSDTGIVPTRLIVTASTGCKDTVENPIKVYPPFNFYIPSAFTPNGDGTNDLFGGIGEGFTSYTMLIFNRWGEIIFESNSYNKRWGLSDRSQDISFPSGVYVYKIKVATPTKEIKEYIGKVTLIK